jgi:hypothetical protein
MYSKEEAEQVYRIASDAIDNAQAKIAEIDSQHSSARTNASAQLLTWQSWLGNISFSLAAIGGALVLGKEIGSWYVLVSLLGYLIVGLWIAIFHKNLMEKSVLSTGTIYQPFSQAYHQKKKLAFEMWRDPANPKRRLSFLKQELKIMNLTKAQELEIEKEYKNQKVNYSNDIWIGVVALSTYLLLRPISEQIADTKPAYELFYWGGFATIVVVLAISALKGRTEVLKSASNSLSNNKDQQRHTKLYSNEIKHEIRELEKKFQIT